MSRRIESDTVDRIEPVTVEETDSNSSLNVENSVDTVSGDVGSTKCQGGCTTREASLWFCPSCEVILCDDCWDEQLAHRMRLPRQSVHEKTPYLVYKRLADILTASSDGEAHVFDEDTKWFGWAQNGPDTPVLEEFEAYSNTFARYAGGDASLKYPQLVSFVGETDSMQTRRVSNSRCGGIERHNPYIS
ncbi:hypothetical protein EJ06DRAFT_65913 [Trichodelitschia bisporula]|uniref:Uncharacterized protein n=1 Tax=Trichodelitschia bisporula TaxID=703511 RepID=A0A6G1HSI3_9PEZI|nr:hypothetical protein EJ06DRAFT_65913 [Trichodelitschia bisporula]